MTAPMLQADPQAPLFRRFSSSFGEHVLVVPHSRIYDVEDALAAEIDRGSINATQLLAPLMASALGEAALDSFVVPTPQSISLNISSSCNLACTYCYAARGG